MKLSLQFILVISLSSQISLYGNMPQEEAWIEKGVLVSSKSLPVVSQKTGELAYLVEDGTWIKKGDLVAEFDLGDLQEKIDQNKDAVQDLEEDLEFQNIYHQKAIRDNQALQDLNHAELDVAMKKLERIKNGATPEEKRRQEIQVQLAQLNLEATVEQEKRQRQLIDKGFASEASLESILIRKKSHQLRVINQQQTLEKLKKQAEPEELKEAQAQVDRYENSIELKKIRLERELKSIALKTEAITLSLQEKMESLKDDLEDTQKSKVFAPQDGLVLLSKKRDWSRGGIFVPIQVGSRLHSRDTIAKVIDPSKVEIQCHIHESDIHRAKLHQNVTVQLPALGPKNYHGKITYISSLGQDLQDLHDFGTIQQEHGQTYFKVIVDVIDQDPRFLPGMSAIVQLSKHASPRPTRAKQTEPKP